MTYAQSIDNSGSTKTLPYPCYNGPSCEFQEPEFMKWDSFINTSTPKYTENNWKWIVCKSSALKAWREEISNCLWSVADEIRSIFDSLLMSDVYLTTLAKSEGSLNTRVQFVEF